MLSVRKLSLVLAMALSAVLLVVGVAACGSRRHRRRCDLRRDGRRDGDVRRGLRGYGRTRCGRQGRGHAQRDRPASGLGELRRDDLHLRVQVRDQDQLGAARRQQPGRDQCGDPAEGHGPRAGRLRPGWQCGSRQPQHVRPLQGRRVGPDSRELEGSDRPVGERLHRLHVDRVQRRQGAGADHDHRPAQARVQGHGRPQRQPDAGFRGLQRRGHGHDRERWLGRRLRPGRGLLLAAQRGRQSPAGGPDAGDDRLGTDADRDRLGLQQRGADRRA